MPLEQPNDTPSIPLPRRDFWKAKNYLTYRRLWLDVALEAFASDMRGRVMDIGGKRENKRGTFQPPEHQAQAWWYVNLDMTTNPNVYADAGQLPLMGQSVDCVICTEVLEHLPRPERCVAEIHRLLRDGGVALISVPFLYPTHADPYDYQRFTEDGLRNLFRDFKTVTVYRMGGYTGVLGLMVELGIHGVEGNAPSKKLARWAMKWISRWLFRADLAAFGMESEAWAKFTTGYFVRAVR